MAYRVVLATMTIAVVFCSEAMAAGFQVREQSSSKLGNAFAGAGSSGDDASILFFNPAGITLFDQAESQAGMSYIRPYSRLRDSSGTDATGGAMSGGDGGNAGSPALIPTLSLIQPLTDRLSAGFSLNAPFGLTTTYNDGWVGRYQALTSKLTTVTATAVGAFKLTPTLSIGGGPSLTYARSRLTRAIDFGSICFGSLGAASCGGAGVTPQGADGAVDLSADATAFGGTLGVLWQPSAGTRIGLSWNSEIDLRFSGDADFTVPSSASFLTAGGAFTDSAASTAAILPETVALSLHHDINEEWAVMADLSWIAWSSFNKLVFDFENPAQPTSILEENWNDAYFASVGVTYRPNERWTFRGGFAYDQSPVKDAYRSPLLPDSDRYWLSLGTEYRLNERASLSASYAHLFFENASINKTTDSGGTLRGQYETSINIFSVGARIRF